MKGGKGGPWSRVLPPSPLVSGSRGCKGRSHPSVLNRTLTKGHSRVNLTFKVLVSLPSFVSHEPPCLHIKPTREVILWVLESGPVWSPGRSTVEGLPRGRLLEGRGKTKRNREDKRVSGLGRVAPGDGEMEVGPLYDSLRR